MTHKNKLCLRKQIALQKVYLVVVLFIEIFCIFSYYYNGCCYYYYFRQNCYNSY